MGRTEGGRRERGRPLTLPDRIAACVIALAVAAAACSSRPSPAPPVEPPHQVSARVDAGGLALSYVCRGDGRPTVLLEAGLDAAGTQSWGGLLPLLDPVGARVCAYDRAGTGSSERSPGEAGPPTVALQAAELHDLLAGAGIAPPYVLVAHSYGGLIARVFADRYPTEVAGFVFEAASTAWEIDLWPRWDDSPWVDGGRVTDIETSRRQVLGASRFGSLPTIVVSQGDYDDEGVPRWAARTFAKQQERLAALGTNVIHLRADNVGHFIHEERPAIMVAAVAAVVEAVRTDGSLPPCPDVFGSGLGTCLT